MTTVALTSSACHVHDHQLLLVVRELGVDSVDAQGDQHDDHPEEQDVGDGVGQRDVRWVDGHVCHAGDQSPRDDDCTKLIASRGEVLTYLSDHRPLGLAGDQCSSKWWCSSSSQ